MGKCYEELFKTVSNNKIDKDDIFELALNRKLPDCRRINALRPVAVSGESTPDRYERPNNQFECRQTGCVNTGVLMMAEADETVTYRAQYDATEFVGGVVTFYVKPGEDAEFPINVTFKIGNEESVTNANEYTRVITEDMVAEDGFAPVVIILADEPTSTSGDGWTPSASGSNYIQLSADKVVGYSSIAIFDELKDFALFAVIQMRCITSAGDDMSFTLIEEQCQAVQYDKNINTIPFSMTAQEVTSNYMQGNPLFGDGSRDFGYVPTTVKKTVETYEVDGQTYGRIALPDMNQEECGRVSVQIPDDCSATILSALSIPTLVDIEPNYFLVLNNEDGSTDVIFDESHIGKTLLVSYPKLIEIEEWVFNPDFLNDVDARITYTRTLSDGTKLIFTYDNVFITTFPMNLTSTTAAFNWSFSIARDREGNFFRVQKVIA